MRKINKSLTCIALIFSLSVPLAFAQSKVLEVWIGTWTVKTNDRSIVTWEITDTWVSDTGTRRSTISPLTLLNILNWFWLMDLNRLAPCRVNIPYTQGIRERVKPSPNMVSYHLFQSLMFQAPTHWGRVGI